MNKAKILDRSFGWTYALISTGYITGNRIAGDIASMCFALVETAKNFHKGVVLTYISICRG